MTMANVRKSLIPKLLLALPLLILANFQPVHADISGKVAESIKTNCGNIKTSLHQLQAANAQARVNLGRNYEDIMEKLMTNMNSRLVTNQKNPGKLLTITIDFNENLGYFRRNYIAYDDHLSHLLSIDCQRQPQEFYAELEKARDLRSDVHFNYDFLNSLIKDYRTELTRLRKELKI